MNVFTSIQEWQSQRKSNKEQTIGLVATMGNLHQGHLSLVSQSMKDNDLTLVSVFVNPTQFNNEEDFANYPNTLAEDLTLLQHAGVDYCLVPTKEQLYPDNYCYQLHETELSQRLEGPGRPGHFNGMLTVVLKLLMLAQADRAYFGEKDYQQYQLIQGMVDAFFIPTRIICCPTIREPSGLALSSRNNRLSASKLEKARLFAQLFHQGPTPEKIKSALRQIGIEVEYVTDYQQRRYAAVHIGSVRLIDNYALSES